MSDMASQQQTEPATSLPGVATSPLAEDCPPFLAALRTAHPTLAIHTRGSGSYAQLRTPFNTAVAAQPLAIVRPTTEAEVASTVAACAAQGVSLSVRAGGHDMWGRSLAGGGGGGRGARRARAGRRERGGGPAHGAPRRWRARRPRAGGAGRAGARHAHGLLQRRRLRRLGRRRRVCVLEGLYGLGVDQIVGARLVTPRGIVDTDDAGGDGDERRKLLWALRGAGTGGLGVVTEIRIRVYERPGSLAGLVMFPLGETEAVLTAFGELCRRDFPDVFSGDFMVVRAPGLGPVLMMLFSYVEESGDLTAAKAYLDKICALGTVVLNTVHESKSTAPA